MLIVALVLAVIGLAALVTAVVTSNELIAWVCIGASVIGVVLLIVDGLRDRSKRDSAEQADEADERAATADVEDYPEEPPVADYEDQTVASGDAQGEGEPAAEHAGDQVADTDNPADNTKS